MAPIQVADMRYFRQSVQNNFSDEDNLVNVHDECGDDSDLHIIVNNND